MNSEPKRPKLPAISDEMKAWCSALAGEVSSWPRAEARSFFGFSALYRGDSMFAALPRTRAMETPNTIAFKLDPPPARLRAALEDDTRISTFGKHKERWFLFELSSTADLHDVLEWLSHAYTAAGKRKNPR